MSTLDDWAVVLLLIGVTAGGGGLLGAFRYGAGLGPRVQRTFLVARRWGLVVSLIAAGLLLVALAVNGEIKVG